MAKSGAARGPDADGDDAAMKALLCGALGPPDRLTVADLPAPQPGAGEAVVEVHFAGLNFFDTLIIEGKYQVKPPLPFSPGGEFSGIVSALGSGVTGLKIGDRVAGYCGYGAARQQLACAASQLSVLPAGLPLDKAAGLIVTYGTSLHALRQRAALQPDETLAVLGASGGVGLAAVEIGVLMGAQVIACASSAEKVAFAQAAGAQSGIDYANGNLKDALKATTGGRGVDVVYDPVGGALSEAAVRALAWKGRLLVIGFAAGPIPAVPLNLVLLKGCDLRGVFWGDFIKREPILHGENMAQILAWAASGALKVQIDSVFPLEQAAEALGRLSRRLAKGKVLLSLR